MSHQSPSEVGEPQGDRGVVLEQPRERGAEVVGLEIQPAQAGLTAGRAQLVGELDVPARMPLVQVAGLAGLGQPLARVLPDHGEQPVARLALHLVEHHQRLVHEADEGVDRLGGAAHALHGREVEGAREHGQPPEHRRLVGLEQSVAPIERSLERLLPRLGRAPLLAQQPERLAQPRGDLRRGEAPHAGGASSIASGIPSRLSQMRATSRALRSSSAKPGCAAAARSTNSRTDSDSISSAGDEAPPASGNVSDGTRQTISPETCRRLAARGQHLQPGHPRSRLSASSAQAATRWSQLSSTIRASWPASAASRRLDTRPLAAGCQPERGGDGIRDHAGVGDGRQLHQPDAVAEVVAPPCRHLQPEPRLAAPGRPRERDQRSAPRAVESARPFPVLRPTKVVSSTGQVVAPRCRRSLAQAQIRRARRQLAAETLELGARRLRPGLVQILGQERPGVELEGGCGAVGVAGAQRGDRLLRNSSTSIQSSSSAHRLSTSSSRRRHRGPAAPPSSCRRATCRT